ncbi:hypothetical protein ACWD9K_20085 [Streptomyces sp. 900116325]
MTTVREATDTPLANTVSQSISLTLDAEIMTDADTGERILIASTTHHQDDLNVVTPAQLRSKVAAARAELSKFEELADRFEAAAAFDAFVAEHHLQVEKWDTSTLPDHLRNSFLAHSFKLTDGRTIIVVPIGQDPAISLRSVRELVAHLERAA